MGNRINSVETGTVRWLRSVDKALKYSETHNRPVFLLFQEIPGCSTCKHFGKDVLSDTEIVSLIEEKFVPCVINNRGLLPSDRKALKRFNEPYLNNPIVRILDGSGKDVVPRVSGVYYKNEILERLNDALFAWEKQGNMTQSTKRENTVLVSMSCFWEGEGAINHLGRQMKGMKRTEAAWFQSLEVVKIEYSEEFPLERFLTEGMKKGYFREVFCEMDNEEQARRVKRVVKSHSFSTFRVQDVRRASESDQKKYCRSSRANTEEALMSENGEAWARARGVR